jgi:hypothetical protein
VECQKDSHAKKQFPVSRRALEESRRYRGYYPDRLINQSFRWNDIGGYFQDGGMCGSEVIYIDRHPAEVLTSSGVVLNRRAKRCALSVERLRLSVTISFTARRGTPSKAANLSCVSFAAGIDLIDGASAIIGHPNATG